MRVTLLLILLGVFSKASADFYPRNLNADVTHYKFSISLSDDSDLIKGSARIFVTFTGDTSVFALDLVNGMEITSHSIDAEASLSHEENKIIIRADDIFKKDQTIEISLDYEGVPSDGLIIGKNKFGDRTFFSDNYPNRARHWIPCVDHLYEKATVEWVVKAPSHYQVIANGLQTEETDLGDNMKLTRWNEGAPIPPKVMVIGVSKFAVGLSGTVDNIPVTAWVYPQNKKEGFYDYELALRPLTYFIENIGPYSYEKLANVQSKTRYGGMENASSIFYSEGSVTGNRTIEPLVAHEVAHQWFGNSASENDWHHIWLSEGFATYFTHLYMEHYYGREKMNERLQVDKLRVINYYETAPAPIINTTIKDYNKILNPNSYQKGGWVLHMLRYEVGDEAFWKAIQTYYARFQNSNAMTSDLKVVFEEVSGRELDVFFYQWVYEEGQPELDITWTRQNGMIKIKIDQIQEITFEFWLEIELVNEDGSTSLEKISVKDRSTVHEINQTKNVENIALDPNSWLLFEGNIRYQGT